MFGNKNTPQETENPYVKSSIYNKRDLVTDFVLPNGCLTMELMISAGGWNCEFWARSGSINDIFDVVAKELSTIWSEVRETERKKGRGMLYAIRRFDLATEKETIANFLINCIESIMTTVNATLK